MAGFSILWGEAHVVERDMQGYTWDMSKQTIGNAIASLLFLIVAIVDFIKDSSGIGAVFLVFAAVYLRLALSDKTRSKPV
jgi:hypothetical protein